MLWNVSSRKCLKKFTHKNNLMSSSINFFSQLCIAFIQDRLGCAAGYGGGRALWLGRRTKMFWMYRDKCVFLEVQKKNRGDPCSPCSQSHTPRQCRINLTFSFWPLHLYAIPLAPNPNRVQTCVCCLFWTNRNCMAVSWIFLSIALSN